MAEALTEADITTGVSLRMAIAGQSELSETHDTPVHKFLRGVLDVDITAFPCWLKCDLY